MESEELLSAILAAPTNITAAIFPEDDTGLDGGEDESAPYISFMTGSRFWIQRVIVPIVVFIGVLGNVATMAVLTRRRMRSSTNVYLTALAASDLLYLVFCFSLSLQHYPKLAEPFHQIYWRYYPFGIWLTDATSSTSVWLTVSFTVERYIAVCHPMKGKVLCTEKRARRVTALVYALCFLATASTPFEYEGKMVPIEVSLPTDASTYAVTAATLSIAEDVGLLTEPTAAILTDHGFDPVLYRIATNDTDFPEKSTPGNSSIPKSEGAEVLYEYTLGNSALGSNKTYRAVFYWFTSVSFVFLPLILLFVFNSFLIHAVHTSRRTRRRMTLVRKAGEQSEASQTQENKITITLIAVVILFVVCQLPTALMLIYHTFAPKERSSAAKEAVLRGLGNLFNLLVAINAASNFLLYCALSGKYRRTFVRTFAPCWAKSWRYMASTRRRTSIRESFHEGGALMRKRVRRKARDCGVRKPRERKESTDSYTLATSIVDDSQCRGADPPQKTSPTSTTISLRLIRRSPSGAPDLLSVPGDDRNGGSQPRLQRHSSAYVPSESRLRHTAAEFFRTRSMGSHGKKSPNACAAATSAATSSSSIPPASGSIGTPSSSITREDSAPLVSEGVKPPATDNFISTPTGRNGNAANGRSGTAAKMRPGFLSRLRNLNSRLWHGSDEGALTTGSTVVITVTDEGRRGVERKGV